MHETNRRAKPCIKKPESPSGEGATLDEIEELLLGEIRVDPFKVGYLTFNEIAKIIHGYFNHEERLMQRDWEIARWQILHFVAPYSKRRLSAKDIAVFAWEKTESKPIPKRENVIDTIEKWQRWEEKHKTDG